MDVGTKRNTDHHSESEDKNFHPKTKKKDKNVLVDKNETEKSGPELLLEVGTKRERHSGDKEVCSKKKRKDTNIHDESETDKTESDPSIDMGAERDRCSEDGDSQLNKKKKKMEKRKSRTNVLIVQKPKFVCRYCKACENSVSELNRHIMKHTYRCELCEFSTDKKGFLKAHHDVCHKEVQKYACVFCNYSSKRRKELANHVQIHTPSERSLQCPECSYTTSWKSNLNRHILRNHTSVKPFSCSKSKCGFSAKDSYSLKEHMAAHSHERKFDCLVCGASYKRLRELNRHHKTHGLPTETIICPECMCMCESGTELLRHTKRMHGFHIHSALDSDENLMKK